MSNKIRKAAGSVSGLQLTDQDLAEINQHTLREFSAAEVFAFKVTLCDNRVDRDGERFSPAALHKLAELFRGKTGIFDHIPTASGQTARIYHTEIVEDEQREGHRREPYTALQARAYMLRDDSTLATVRSIEAGIRKEVSVGCMVGRITCSVCGADPRGGPCSHRKGQLYDGEACHHLLEDPTDAYEWSFVAVPAQPGAGVTKSVKGATGVSRNITEVLDGVRVLFDQTLKQLEELFSVSDENNNPDEPLPPDGDAPPEDLIKSVQTLLEHTERSVHR